ncbi:MAG: hypothetical protein K2X66_09515 [Cyanobacteria bacterium]|nr:hypothetical protein [Cyanobacteriota bacterium]
MDLEVGSFSMLKHGLEDFCCLENHTSVDCVELWLMGADEAPVKNLKIKNLKTATHPLDWLELFHFAYTPRLSKMFNLVQKEFTAETDFRSLQILGGSGGWMAECQ